MVDLRPGRSARGARPLLLSLCILALTIYPALLSLSELGMRAVFRYSAADAFYYLAVAQNARDALVPTFDGTFSTNGFHPLWQALLSCSAWAFQPSDLELLLGSFWLSLACVAGGSVCLALAVLRLTGSFWWSLFATVPGFFYWAFGSLDPHHYASWSLIDGMESGLSCLSFGGFVWAVFRLDIGKATPRQLALPTLLLTAAVLARLDDVFYVPAFGAYCYCTGPRRRVAAERLLVVLGVPTITLALYLATNLAYAGQALPISGTMKNDGLTALLRNLGNPLTTLLPWASDLLYGGGSQGYAQFAQKSLGLLVPGAVAAGFLASRASSWRVFFRLPGDTGPASFLACLAAGASLKALYNFVFVGIWSQGSWYFTANLMTLHLILAHLLSQAVTLHRAPTVDGPGRRSRWGARLAAVGVIWIGANAFATTKGKPGYHDHYYQFWQERSLVERQLSQLYGDAGVLAYDDGVIAFSLPRRVMSGLGYSLDVEAAQAKRRGELLAVAYRRGVRVIASTNYLPDLGGLESSEDVRRALRYGTSAMKWEKLDAWDFSVVHLSGVSSARFVSFRPRLGLVRPDVDQDAGPGLSQLLTKVRKRVGG